MVTIPLLPALVLLAVAVDWPFPTPEWWRGLLAMLLLLGGTLAGMVGMVLIGLLVRAIGYAWDTLLFWRLTMRETAQSMIAATIGTGFISGILFAVYRLTGSLLKVGVTAVALFVASEMSSVLFGDHIFGRSRHGFIGQFRGLVPWQREYWKRAEKEGRDVCENYYDAYSIVSDFLRPPVTEIGLIPRAHGGADFPSLEWLTLKQDWLDDVAAHHPEFEKTLADWRQKAIAYAKARG